MKTNSGFKSNGFGRLAIAGCAIILLAVAPARGESSEINVRLVDNAVQVSATVTQPFYLQWRTPAGEWQTWAEASLPEPQAGCIWMRAVFAGADPFQWEVPADADSVYAAADGTSGHWVTIGRVAANGVYQLVAPADVVPPSAPEFGAGEQPAPAANNQVRGRPDPGRVKVYWYNTGSRLVACWGLTATGALKSAGFSNDGGMTSGWEFRGIGDINRDGIGDILWHNSNSRLVAFWLMAADGYIDSSGLCTNTPMASGWELRGVGDINQDGTADILWHNSTTRRVAYWMLNADGTLDKAGFCSTNTMASGWEFRATGDIDGDGTLDIFWHNANTKRVAYWTLNSDGSLKTSGFCNDGTMSGGWVLSATGDINNDGASDLIWYNSTTRMTAYWLINSSGSMTTSGYCNASAMSTGWNLTGAGL